MNIPNNNYDKVLCELKEKRFVVDVEPVIGDSMLSNISRRFYVKLQESGDLGLLQNTALALGVDIVDSVSQARNWYVLQVNKNCANSLENAKLFWETHFFSDVDPGFIFHFASTSEDSCVTDNRFGEQWGMNYIKTCSAWKITTGDTNIRIAVIDMGIDENHSEFDNTHVVYSFDVETRTAPARLYFSVEQRDAAPPEATVDEYHGIHVGGIIFANHNKDSIAGIAPNTGMINISHRLIVNSDFDTEKFVVAIDSAVAKGASVINNSWGDHGGSIHYLHSAYLEDAIDNAIENECVIVFSSGNDSNEAVNYPANYRPEILVVSSITESYNMPECANYNQGLDIVAPGGHILSAHNNNSYYYMTGTSMAAPHVSGVAGLMLSINPDLTGQEVRDIIEQTAQKLPGYDFDSAGVNGTWNPYMGYGLLDAHRAVLKAAYHKVYGDTALAICDTSVRAYTVRAPHNANIDSVSFFWTCTDNLQMVAGISIGNEKLEIRNYGKC